MCNFRINEKVVSRVQYKELQKGEIYTVAQLNTCACGEVGVRLNEVNGDYTGYICDCGTHYRLPGGFYNAKNFRRPDYAFAENLLAGYAADYTRKMNDLQEFFNSRK